MKILRLIALALLCAAGAAQAQEDPLVVQLRADYGWHGVGGNVQVNQPTLRVQVPYVSMWQRTPRGERYGDWLYVQVIVDCSQWKQIPFAVLDDDLRYRRMEELTGDFPTASWPGPGTEPYRTMTAVCGLVGYTRPSRMGPPPTANADGTPFVGGIKKLSDHQPPAKPHVMGVP